MADKKLVDILTTDSYNYLLSKTAKVLPNNPTEQGWTADRIKRCYYEGFIVIFEWLKKMQSDINSVFNKDGVYKVEMAEKDGLGNIISDTYATKNKLTNIQTYLENQLNTLVDNLDSGNVIVNKAYCDSNGNNISETYLKANRVTSNKEDIDTTKVITLALGKELIADLVNGADGSLDTLKELADALGNDPNFATTVLNNLDQKLSKQIAEAKYLTIVDAENKYALATNVNNLESSITNLTTKHNTDVKNLETDISNLTTKIATNATSEDIINLFK